ESVLQESTPEQPADSVDDIVIVDMPHISISNFFAKAPPTQDTPPGDEAPASNGNGSAKNDATPAPATDPELGPYIYRDARGNPPAKVIRTPNGKSRFTKKHWNGKTWQSGMADRKLPYRLPELLAADPAEWVCITEGEKDAVNVAKLGIIATTN